MLSCTGAAAGPAPLIAHDAWVRATPGVEVAAAYLTLHNGGTRAVVVIGVRSALAGHAMIHETALNNGQSSMRPHARLSIAPGQTVRLEPGGLHVMLSMLAHPLAPGEQVPLQLLLEGGGTLAVIAPVRPPGAG
jgi:periplasmic copper chaperone A